MPQGSVDTYAATTPWSQIGQVKPLAAAPQPPANLKGDVNGDDVVDVDDLNLVINIMVKKASMSQWPDADVDGNGIVDVDDLNHVINVIVRKA